MSNSKTGFDYYNTDTDRYQDYKIKRLKKNFKCEGIAIYDYILCEIYRVKGFYLEWNDNVAFDISEYFGIDENMVTEILNYCFDIKLFDQKMYEKEAIITSKSIQNRFMLMSLRAKRKGFKIPEKYLIIQEESLNNKESFHKVEKTGEKCQEKPLEIINNNQNESTENFLSQINIPEFPEILPEESPKMEDECLQNTGSLPQSKVKESKEKEIIHTDAPPQSGKPKNLDFIDQIIEGFSEEYEENKKIPYVVVNRGKERKAAGALLKVYKDKHKGSSSAETLKVLKDYFKSVMEIKDSWLSANMSLPLLMSKFNEVNNQLRNGSAKKCNSKASDGSTAIDIAKYLGAKYNIPIKE